MAFNGNTAAAAREDDQRKVQVENKDVIVKIEVKSETDIESSLDNPNYVKVKAEPVQGYNFEIKTEPGAVVASTDVLRTQPTPDVPEVQSVQDVLRSSHLQHTTPAPTTMQCFLCQTWGHPTASCPDLRCKLCQRQGHAANSCTQQPTHGPGSTTTLPTSQPTPQEQRLLDVCSPSNNVQSSFGSVSKYVFYFGRIRWFTDSKTSGVVECMEDNKKKVCFVSNYDVEDPSDSGDIVKFYLKKDARYGLAAERVKVVKRGEVDAGILGDNLSLNPKKRKSGTLDLVEVPPKASKRLKVVDIKKLIEPEVSPTELEIPFIDLASPTRAPTGLHAGPPSGLSAGPPPGLSAGPYPGLSAGPPLGAPPEKCPSLFSISEPKEEQNSIPCSCEQSPLRYCEACPSYSLESVEYIDALDYNDTAVVIAKIVSSTAYSIPKLNYIRQHPLAMLGVRKEAKSHLESGSLVLCIRPIMCGNYTFVTIKNNSRARSSLCIKRGDVLGVGQNLEHAKIVSMIPTEDYKHVLNDPFSYESNIYASRDFYVRPGRTSRTKIFMGNPSPKDKNLFIAFTKQTFQNAVSIESGKKTLQFDEKLGKSWAFVKLKNNSNVTAFYKKYEHVGRIMNCMTPSYCMRIIKKNSVETERPIDDLDTSVSFVNTSLNSSKGCTEDFVTLVENSESDFVIRKTIFNNSNSVNNKHKEEITNICEQIKSICASTIGDLEDKPDNLSNTAKFEEKKKCQSTNAKQKGNMWKALIEEQPKIDKENKLFLDPRMDVWKKHEQNKEVEERKDKSSAKISSIDQSNLKSSSSRQSLRESSSKSKPRESTSRRSTSKFSSHTNSTSKSSIKLKSKESGVSSSRPNDIPEKSIKSGEMKPVAKLSSKVKEFFKKQSNDTVSNDESCTCTESSMGSCKKCPTFLLQCVTSDLRVKSGDAAVVVAQVIHGEKKPTNSPDFIKQLCFQNLENLPDGREFNLIRSLKNQSLTECIKPVLSNGFVFVTFKNSSKKSIIIEKGEILGLGVPVVPPVDLDKTVEKKLEFNIYSYKRVFLKSRQATFLTVYIKPPFPKDKHLLVDFLKSLQSSMIKNLEIKSRQWPKTLQYDSERNEVTLEVEVTNRDRKGCMIDVRQHIGAVKNVMTSTYIQTVAQVVEVKSKETYSVKSKEVKNSEADYKEVKSSKVDSKQAKNCKADYKEVKNSKADYKEGKDSKADSKELKNSKAESKELKSSTKDSKEIIYCKADNKEVKNCKADYKDGKNFKADDTKLENSKADFKEVSSSKANYKVRTNRKTDSSEVKNSKLGYQVKSSTKDSKEAKNCKVVKNSKADTKEVKNSKDDAREMKCKAVERVRNKVLYLEKRIKKREENEKEKIKDKVTSLEQRIRQREKDVPHNKSSKSKEDMELVKMNIEKEKNDEINLVDSSSRSRESLLPKKGTTQRELTRIISSHLDENPSKKLRTDNYISRCLDRKFTAGLFPDNVFNEVKKHGIDSFDIVASEDIIVTEPTLLLCEIKHFRFVHNLSVVTPILNSEHVTIFSNCYEVFNAKNNALIHVMPKNTSHTIHTGDWLGKCIVAEDMFPLQLVSNHSLAPEMSTELKVVLKGELINLEDYSDVVTRSLNMHVKFKIKNEKKQIQNGVSGSKFIYAQVENMSTEVIHFLSGQIIGEIVKATEPPETNPVAAKQFQSSKGERPNKLVEVRAEIVEDLSLAPNSTELSVLFKVVFKTSTIFFKPTLNSDKLVSSSSKLLVFCSIHDIYCLGNPATEYYFRAKLINNGKESLLIRKEDNFVRLKFSQDDFHSFDTKLNLEKIGNYDFSNSTIFKAYNYRRNILSPRSSTLMDFKISTHTQKKLEICNLQGQEVLVLKKYNANSHLVIQQQKSGIRTENGELKVLIENTSSFDQLVSELDSTLEKHIEVFVIMKNCQDAITDAGMQDVPEKDLEGEDVKKKMDDLQKAALAYKIALDNFVIAPPGV